jgi:hypothetical protein
MLFENFIMYLDEWGVTDVLLPFILIFTIVYATLQKTKILGEGKKQFNVVIALVMALGVVIPHVTGSYSLTFDPVLMINRALPHVSIILVAIIMMLLIVGVFGNEIDIAGTSLAGWVVIFAIVAVALIFGSDPQIGWFSIPWLAAFLLVNPEVQALVIMILIFGVIIWFITKEPKKDEEKRGFGKFIEGFGKSVQKKSGGKE